MNKSFIVLGPPGSGKGTQAKKLADHLELNYFGTGDLMRQEAAKKSPLGIEFDKVWKNGQGNLVNDELVERFVTNKLTLFDLTKGIVFDGYPRTIYQAQSLDKIFSDNSIIMIVLNLQVKTESLIRRMETRRICSKCDEIYQDPGSKGIEKCQICNGKLINRQEDEAQVLRKRITVYHQQTEPIIDYYKKKDVLININGEPPIEEVWKEIKEKIQ